MQPNCQPLGDRNSGVISIYDALDYRDFLRSRILESKTLSLASVARRSGCVSKSYLSLIINKKRDLRDEKAVLVGRAIGLKGRELKYFESLVRFNRTKDQIGKEHFLRELASLRPRTPTSVTYFDESELLQNWHALAIRECAALPQFNGDPQRIAALFRGLLSAVDVRRALNLLLQTGLLVQDGGKFAARTPAIQSTDEIRSLAIRKYHQSCLELSRHVLEVQSLQEREFGSVNVSVSNEGFQKIKERLKALRTEILEIALNDAAPDRVCQLNFQFFHLSSGDRT